MSKKKTGKTGLSERAGDFAKNIWLAGIGAYGEAYDEMTNQQKSIKELPQLFKELVEKGAGLETTDPTSKRGKKNKPAASGSKTKTSKSSVLDSESLEQRIRRMREGLNLNWAVQSSPEIQRLESKIDSLGEEIQTLKALLQAQIKTSKPATKRTAKAAKKTKVTTSPKTKPKSKATVKTAAKKKVATPRKAKQS